MSRYSIFVNGGSSPLNFDLNSLEIPTIEIYNRIIERYPYFHSFFISFQGKPIPSSNLLFSSYVPFFSKESNNDDHILPPQRILQLFIQPTEIKGGKGGFGQALRSIGRAIARKKETNFEECRDLDGRRIRDVEHEQRITQWEEKKKELIEKKKNDEIQRKKEEEEEIATRIEEEKKSLQDNDSGLENAVMSAMLTSNKKKKKKKRKKKKKKKGNKKKKNDLELEAVNYESLISPAFNKKRPFLSEANPKNILPPPDFTSDDQKIENKTVLEGNKKKKRKRRRKKNKKRKREDDDETIKPDGQPPLKKRKV